MRRLVVVAGVLAFALSAVVIARSAETAALSATWRAARDHPAGMALALAAYALAFGVRALAWQRVLPGLAFGHALAAIHVSLAANHLLPLRLGETLRVVSVVRRAGVGTAEATASTIALRAADLAAVLALAAALAPGLLVRVFGAWGWAVAAGIVVVGLVAWRWLRTLADAKRPGALVAVAAAGAWVLEAGVVWQAARWAGLRPSFSEALLVTVVSVAAQVVAVAPGGFGTYEAAAVAAWALLGAPAGPALAAALAAHAVKTAYALVTGAVAAFVPAPALFGTRAPDPSAVP
jgi:uncharacterized membrane protein YbhN (UPF0104 family)